MEHRAKTGLTPLMEAASGGYVEVGRVLLDKGQFVMNIINEHFMKYTYIH